MGGQQCVLSILRYAAEAAVVVVAAVMVVAAVVVLLVVEESHGTILGLKIARFCRFLKRRNGRTYGRTDGYTDERTDRPSYRDARTYLKNATCLAFKNYDGHF